VGCYTARRGDSARQGASRGDVVFLDEGHVVKPDPVVLSAAATDGVLLRGAQTGKCLTGIDDDAARAGYGIYETTRFRCGR